MGVTPKNILIISPESWGKSKVSKHHYALACANEGHTVFFLTTINEGTLPTNSACEDHLNIKLVYFCLSKPLNILRFHWRFAYQKLLQHNLKIFLKDFPRFDVVISFDCNGVFTDLSNFHGRRTIFFPVDQVNERYRKVYKGFDELISISPVILRAFPEAKNVKLQHHGLSPYFANKNYTYNETKQVKNIAYVGNLLIGPILDKAVIKEIINNNTDLQFHFYGAHEVKNNNLGANLSSETLEYIEFLKASKNCSLHGMVSPKELADAYNNMDAFLVCYNYKYDKNECSNSHKIMEYLATGKPIISTRVSMYDDKNLFSMLDTFDNSLFSVFFNQQILDWKKISNLELYKKRIAFANSNTYTKLLENILN